MAANELSSEDVYIDKDGNRVSGDSPEAAAQIAFKGVKIDARVAARYKDAMSAGEPKAARKPEADVVSGDAKARKSSPAKK